MFEPRLSSKIEEEIFLAVQEFVLADSKKRRGVADMTPLIELTSAAPLKNLGAWENRIRWIEQVAIYQGQVPKWKFWIKPKVYSNLWIGLCSGDGHRREDGLRKLTGAAPNAFFFALALRRLNDWVPQVRDAARLKLPAMAKKSAPEIVAEALCALLPHWNSWGRSEQEDRDAILEMLARPAVTQLVKSRIISEASGPMVSILSQAGRGLVLDQGLEDIAKNAIQPFVRAKAYRCLLSGRVTWMEKREWQWIDIRYCKGRKVPVISERALSVDALLVPTLELASKDSSSIVRRVAGEYLIRELSNLEEEAPALAKRLAADLSPAVAERGNFALKKLGIPI